MLSGPELEWEIQLTDWSTAGNLSSWSSGVQIPHDICTCFGCYLYFTKCSWIIKMGTGELNAGVGVEILLVALCYGKRDKLWSDWPLGWYTDFT